jgi:hypothetical protein
MPEPYKTALIGNVSNRLKEGWALCISNVAHG